MPYYLVYIFQQTGYETGLITKKLYARSNLGQVKKRGKLEKTTKAKLLLMLSYALYLFVLAAIFIALLQVQYWLAGGLALFLPSICIFGLLIPVIVANVALQFARQGYIKVASEYFAEHKAIKVAVMGSYGKTSIKQLLLDVLGSNFSVAATPGNQNVPISIARWSKTLNGNEQVLIFEYGESKPGDIATLANLTHPAYAFAAGIAPNHLDGYKTKQALADDFSSITGYVDAKNLLVNSQMQSVFGDNPDIIYYSDSQVGDWQISDVNVSINGLEFNISSGSKTINISSKLLGRHNIGPLAAVAVFADKLGVANKEIEANIAKTEVYEHRMQPRQLHGAWIIDDTYNGNLEGFRAGLALLAELPAKRKIYVTPGLVEQGSETEAVHLLIGEAIAKANPDMVVLMENSVTKYILSGLRNHKYAGIIKTEPNPLGFYTNIEQFVANGDIVLMQNDWPDGYN